MVKTTPKSRGAATSAAKVHLAGDKAQQQGAEGTPAASKSRGRPAKAQEQAAEPKGNAGGLAQDDKAPGGDQPAGEVQTMQIGDHVFEVVPIPARAGKTKPEEFPFSKLPLSKVTPTGIVGASMFIFDDQNPQKHLTAARAQVAGTGIQYHTRKQEKDAKPGIRIWKTDKTKPDGD